MRRGSGTSSKSAIETIMIIISANTSTFGDHGGLPRYRGVESCNAGGVVKLNGGGRKGRGITRLTRIRQLAMG
jgi:hypothetical protein